MVRSSGAVQFVSIFSLGERQLQTRVKDKGMLCLLPTRKLVLDTDFDRRFSHIYILYLETATLNVSAFILQLKSKKMTHRVSRRLITYSYDVYMLALGKTNSPSMLNYFALLYLRTMYFWPPGIHFSLMENKNSCCYFFPSFSLDFLKCRSSNRVIASNSRNFSLLQNHVIAK